MALGQARKGFDLDLAEGLEKESELLELIRGGKVELKTDYIARNTHNVCVEVHSPSGPSGIVTTEADW